MLLFSLLPLALADGATRCVATWSGPDRGCAIRGDIQIVAAGPSSRGAERALRRQVGDVVDAHSAAMLADIPYMDSAEFLFCEDSIRSGAKITCNEEPQLQTDSLCFAVFDDPECWNGDVITLEDVGWLAVDTGRREMCEKVDARLVRQNYTGLAVRRAECRARCEENTVVTCPSGQ